MPDVVIVGGGVVGCAAAYYLTKAGAIVTLIERDEVGGAASGAAAGMLVPPAEAIAGGTFHDFCHAGVDAYPDLVQTLQEETSIDVQYLATGILLTAASDQRARALEAVAGGRALGLDAEWAEGETLRALEPALSNGLLGAAFMPDARQVNPGLLTQALARAAERRGAALIQGTAVAGLQRSGSHVNAVRTEDGEAISCDRLVLAAGPWTARLGRRLGVSIPTRPMRGQMLAYRSTALRHMVWGEDGYLVPKAGGFLFAGATVEEVGFRPGTTKRGLTGMRRMAKATVPALRYADVASSWAGLRPGSPDGQPIIGPLPGYDNVVVATGHFRNGILLGPITGKLVAQLITGEATELPLGPFHPARFGKGTDREFRL